MSGKAEQKSFATPDETRTFDYGALDLLPQGHDAWVVGDEPVVVVDWYGASTYARG